MLKKFFEKIPASLTFLFKLYFFSLLLFLAIRIIFFIYNKSSDIVSTPFNDVWLAFQKGVEFDTAVICWSAIIPIILIFLGQMLNKKNVSGYGFYLLAITLLLLFFTSVADIPYFKQFGNHLNRAAFLWNNNPDFAAGVIFGDLTYWGFVFIFLPIAVIFILFFRKILRSYRLKEQSQSYTKLNAVILFIISGTCIFSGARGQVFEKTGLHEGIAIVSQNNFINHVAINANFTFWKSMINVSITKNYLVPPNINNHIQFTRDYLEIKMPFEKSIRRELGDTINHPYNIVLVVMESMCQFKMGYYNGENKTPYLDKLNKESIFLSNFFSSGIHTFNGLFSISSGYPSIYDNHSLRSYVKKPFNALATLLSDRGYETYFYTTHDPHFDNMKGYFTLNKFEHIISEHDFDPALSEGSLGVPDHILLDKIIQTSTHRQSSKPFLAVAMTASDHGPWRIPQNIPFKPKGKTPQDNCTLYADWSIGKFIETAKKQSWYDNTVFIFVGDHGLSMGHTYEMPISYHHVPCIIHQPKLFKADTISSPCYQPDIPATIMGIIGGKYLDETFGVNVLKKKHPFVVFSADDKIGCVDSMGNYYYHTLSNGETYLRKYQNLDPVNYKSIQKSKADSMHKNMMHIYNAAQYFLQRDYVLYE